MSIRTSGPVGRHNCCSNPNLCCLCCCVAAVHFPFCTVVANSLSSLQVVAVATSGLSAVKTTWRALVRALVRAGELALVRALVRAGTRAGAHLQPAASQRARPSTRPTPAPVSTTGGRAGLGPSGQGRAYQVPCDRVLQRSDPASQLGGVGCSCCRQLRRRRRRWQIWRPWGRLRHARGCGGFQPWPRARRC